MNNPQLCVGAQIAIVACSQSRNESAWVQHKQVENESTLKYLKTEGSNSLKHKKESWRTWIFVINVFT